MEKKIEVSVHIVVYNHEKYIEQCLESVVSQICEFEYEILIGDDASTDHSQRLINKIAQKYPSKNIRTFLRKTNVGPFQNHYQLFKETKGEFITICEGDDYWIDSQKLQKQYNALKQNPECIACHTWQKLATFDNDKNIFVEIDSPKEGNGYLKQPINDVSQIFRNKMRPKVRTIMFRNIFKDHSFPSWYTDVKFGDEALNFTLGKFGKFYFIDEEMAVYRQTTTGMSSIFNNIQGYIQGTKDWIYEYDVAANYYNGKYDKDALIGITFFMKRLFNQRWFGLKEGSKFLMWVIVFSKIRLKVRKELVKLIIANMFSKKTIA